MSNEVLLWPLWVNFDLDWGPQWGRCWDCGGLTRWADLSFMVYLHPGLCAKRKWAEYWEAERAAGPITPWDPPDGRVSIGVGE